EWEMINENFAHNIKFSTEIDGQIVGAIHNSQISEFSVFSSADAGETWNYLNAEDLFEIRSNHVFSATAFSFNEDVAEVYIGSGDLGLVKYTLDLETMAVSNPEFISHNQTEIYPNPASDIVNISTKSLIKSVEVYSLTGQKINSETTSGTLNISHLNKGIYLIKIQLENGRVETHKLIKK